MFRFDPNKFDFWEIYHCIKKYYPIGITREEGLFFSYPGLQTLEKILIENIHDIKNFNTRWNTFHTIIGEKTKKPVVGTTYGQAPCFSAYVELEKIVTSGLTRLKEIHFFVSLVGPFYTIYGMDRNEIQMDDHVFYSTNFLTISPEMGYAETFGMLCNLIENRFKDYRFVPYWIYIQRIEGLAVRYADEKLDTVFHALFNSRIELHANTLGNSYYKSEVWIPDTYTDEGNRWTAYPPQK